MKGRIGWLTAMLAAVALAGCGTSVDELMQRAAEQRAEGMYQSAIADYRSVLQEEPDHAEARFGLGEVMLAAGDDAGAAEALGRAADLGIDPARVQPLLATALLRQNRPDELLLQIQPDAVSAPDIRADLLAAIGGAHLQAERYDDAGDALEAALALDVDSIRALVTHALLAQAENQPAEAGRRAERALEINPDSAAAWMIRADLARQAGRSDEAISHFMRLMDLPATDITQSEHFNARGRLAETLLSVGRADEAKAQVAVMLRQSGRHPYSNYLAALIAYGEDDIETANDHLQTTLSQAPNSLPAKALMGSVKLRQQQYSQAITLLQEVVSGRPDDLGSRVTLAAAFRDSGRTRQAARVLTAGIQHFADDPRAMVVLAESAGEDIGEVIENLERAARTDRDAQQAKLAFAQALAAQGSIEPALALLDQPDLADSDSRILRRQVLAVSALRGGDAERALGEAQALMAEHSESATAHNLAGGIYLTLQRFSDARQAFEAALRLEPDGVQATMNMGRLAIAEGNLDQAEDYLQRGLAASPRNLPGLQTLAGVHHQQGETDKAVALLRRAVDYEPRELQPRLALARYLQDLGDLDAAVEQAGQAVRYAPRNFEALGLLGLLRLQTGDIDAALGTAQRLQQLENGMDIGAMLEGRAWAERGNMEAAVQAYQRAADRGRREALGPLVAGRADLGMDNPAQPLEAWIGSNPDDGGARASLAQWHTERGDYAAAAVQYEALVELTSRGNPAMLNNLAWTYQQMDDGRALALAREAHALAPDNAAIKDTLGWIELQAGNWQQALTLLAEAVKAAPEDRTFRYHYAAALAQSGREEDARVQLAPALADDAPFHGREDAVKLLDSLR